MIVRKEKELSAALPVNPHASALDVEGLRHKRRIEELMRRNNARKAAHPGWPTHKVIMYPPRGRPVLVSECVPISKLDHTRGYCKYCYETHDNWWLMDQEDYDIDGLTIILCGNCEHTSAASIDDDPKPIGAMT